MGRISELNSQPAILARCIPHDITDTLSVDNASYYRVDKKSYRFYEFSTGEIDGKSTFEMMLRSSALQEVVVPAQGVLRILFSPCPSSDR